MQQGQYYYYFLLLGLLLFSCNEPKQGDVPVIPVDIENNTVLQLPLSEITESITAIELELTDKSLIHPRRIRRIILSDDMIIIAQSTNILLFNRNGTFVRSIGSIGQGPGEYAHISNITIDETNGRLFVNCSTKIICYDLQGNALMESSIPQSNSKRLLWDINWFNNEILLVAQSMGNEDEKGVFDHAEVLRLNDNLQIIDSSTILKFYGSAGFSTSAFEDFILISDSIVYLYYPFSTAVRPDLIGKIERKKTVLRDTLYRFENNQLIPDLKLKFNNDGIDFDGYMFINLFMVYRSSRYIFAHYVDYSKGINDNDFHFVYNFCYDTKTGKGYRVENSRYTDDINHIEEVIIRPVQTNPELFYYWHTHMKPGNLEEPNPTLYIGKLKK